VPTLTQIWRDVLPTATWLSPEVAPTGADGPAWPDPEIAWVRVLRARIPALEGLEAGDFAIVPDSVLSALASGPADPLAVVAELTRVGVSAILLVAEDPGGPIASRLVEAARARSTPVLRVPSADPGALERSLVGYLVNRRAELDRQAAQVDAAVERLALEGRGLEAMAGAVGASLGRAVVIEDERGLAVTIHAPASVSGAAAAATRYLAQPRQAALRVALPGAGSLALLGPQPVSDLDRAVAERVAPLLALEMGRQVLARRPRGSGRAESLPADGPPWVVVIGRQIVPGEDTPAEERERRRERLARLAPPRRLLLRGDATSVDYRLVAALPPDDPRGLALATRIASTIGRDVAASRPFARPEERSAAEAEARATLEASEAIPPAAEVRQSISHASTGSEDSVGADGLGAPSSGAPRVVPAAPSTRGAGIVPAAPSTRGAGIVPAAPSTPGAQLVPAAHSPVGPRVVLAERLAAYRMLGDLHNLPNGPRLAGTLLAPLLAGGSAATKAQRLATLRAVLEHPGAAAAAEVLGIHRNTLLYRVVRIEERTGWRLDDPDLRLALAIAVRLVQNDQ
jgi:PucR C-terminal helix-turn-helix domain